MFNKKVEKWLDNQPYDDVEKFEAWVIKTLAHEAFYEEDVSGWTIEEVKQMMEEVD